MWGALDTRERFIVLFHLTWLLFSGDVVVSSSVHTHLVFLSSAAVSLVSAQREWATEEVGVCCASNLKHSGEASRSRLSAAA